MRWTALIPLLLLVGCEKPKDWQPVYHPDHFAHWSDRMKERFPELQTVFGPSCLWRNDWQAVDRCFAMDEPQHWRGLWREDFEFSRFCPAPATDCSDESGGLRIWLSAAASSGMPEYRGQPLGALYEIEFIGRRTKYPGYFGHLGQYDHEIIVDRLTAIKELEPARQE